MEHLFEKPSIYHYILSLDKEQVQVFGNMVFPRLRMKDPDFMKPVYFLLRKGYNANSYITRKNKKFIPTAVKFDEMFVEEEVKKHCFDYIIDMFEDYEQFEEDALLYFFLCGIDLDQKCEDDEKSGTLRQKIKNKWEEFGDFEELETFSFSYMIDLLHIENVNRYGIDLNNKKFLLRTFTPLDYERCIQMYCNDHVSEYTLEQALKAFNLELIQNSSDIFIPKHLVQFLVSNIQNKTAQEALILLSNRVMELSVHDIQQLPQNKKEQLLKVYKTPMYLSNPNYKKRMFKHFFGKEEVPEEFINKIIHNQELRDELVSKFREVNKNCIIDTGCTIFDLYNNSKPTIVNETDLVGDCVYDYPLTSLVFEREKDVIYVFTPNDYDNLVKNKKNPYTNTEIGKIPEIIHCMSITDFLEEMTNGKKLNTENVNQTVQVVPQIIMYDFDLFPLPANNPFQMIIQSFTNGLGNLQNLNNVFPDEDYE